MEESKSTKLNFRYFIRMALQRKISWETLLVFLDDLTPTLAQSKQAIEVLVKELQALQTKLQVNVGDDDIVEIIENDTPNDVSCQNVQQLINDLDISKDKSENGFRQFHVDATNPKVESQFDEIIAPTKDSAEMNKTKKEFPEVEIIDIE